VTKEEAKRIVRLFKYKLLTIIREDVISTHGSPIVGVNVGEKVGVHVGVTVGCSD